MMRVVLNESNNLIYINDLEDVLNTQYVNTAAVDVWLFEDDKVTEVVGETWPLRLDYIPGSNGDYVKVVDDDIVLVVGGGYFAKVVIDDGPGRRLTEWHQLEIVDRQP